MKNTKEKTKKNKENLNKIKKKKGNKGKHLTFEDRYVIEKMLKAKRKQKTIAEVLKISESAVSKEIKRGSVINKKTGKKEYIAIKAQHKAYLRQYWKKKNCLKVVSDVNLLKFIEKRIEKGWSPETISERIKEKHNNFENISAKAIRKYLEKGAPRLLRFLYWNRNHKKRGPKPKKTSYLQDKQRKTLTTRAVIYPNLDNEFGHWEMDFIVSKHNKYVLLVLVEKKTKYTLIKLLKNRKNTLVNKKVFSILKNFKVLSVTTDNDIAFSKWKDLENILNTNIFFTDPYCSWQKGLVENTNKWIRQFIPKRTDLSKLNDKYTRNIQDWLNHWPKIVLNGSTPYEALYFESNHVKISSLLVDLPKKIW